MSVWIRVVVITLILSSTFSYSAELKSYGDYQPSFRSPWLAANMKES